MFIIDIAVPVENNAEIGNNGEQSFHKRDAATRQGKSGAAVPNRLDMSGIVGQNAEKVELCPKVSCSNYIPDNITPLF